MCEKRIALDKSSKGPKDHGRTAANDIGVVLVGRGSLYSRQPETELAGLADHIRSLGTGWVVAEALLEQGGPSVPDALAACARAGAEKLVVLPAFMPVEIATRNWLRFVARRWQEQSATSAQVILTESLSGQAVVRDAAIRLVQEAAKAVAQPISVGHKTGTPEPDWSVIPTHDHHVLFCHGPRCTASGAAELGAFFRKLLKDAGMDEGPRQVLAARSGCLYPCNLGPVMVVYPEGIWYCGLDESALAQIVDQHFRNGEPVGANAFRPSPFPQSLPPSGPPKSRNIGA